MTQRPTETKDFNSKNFLQLPYQGWLGRRLIINVFAGDTQINDHILGQNRRKINPFSLLLNKGWGNDAFWRDLRIKLLHSYFNFNFLDHLARKCLPAIYPCFKELINNSRKYVWWFLFFGQTNKTCQETLFDWLIIRCLVWVTKQDFIVHSQSHSLEASWSPTTSC